ncbi:ABC transporter substrate-binding protein [Rhizobium terrae]|uniref:ABC transporter substrate-binding protein n=1 Tax=Rhizobium terrae TaxID=2171756 RepID=UPI000E3B600B|nr:ABC transporter substrate-binding protein [Rhizobium terrae]
MSLSRSLLHACLSSVALALPGLAMASTLTVQITADIRSSQPGINRDAGTDSVMLNVVEGLVAAGEKGEIRPMLAKDWSVSADGKAYTFTIRDGVKFHNGETMTAADVEWSLEKLIRDPEFSCKTFFDGSRDAKVETIKATDDRTVVITLDRPDAMFLNYMAQAQCGSTGIVHRASFNGDGSWKAPVATGPFVFGDWKRGEGLVLKKFADYSITGDKPDGYGGRKDVLVDQVKYMVVPDTATAVAGLRSGALDVLPYLPPGEAAKLKDEKDFTIVAAPHGGLVTMLFQTTDTLMSNVAMRHAVIAALDTPAIVDSVTYGLGIPNNSLVSSGSLYHTATHDKGYVYDPQAVPALLQKAGYKGEKIVILTNRRSAINYDTAIIAQAMLQSAGINAEIEVLEWASQLDRFNSGKYQIMAFNYSNRTDPGLAYQTVVGSKAKKPNTVWDDADVAALVNKSLQEADPEKRQAIFDDLHARFLDQAPFVMLANGLDVGVSGPKVRGYRTWQGFARFWGVERSE